MVLWTILIWSWKVRVNISRRTEMKSFSSWLCTRFTRPSKSLPLLFTRSDSSTGTVPKLVCDGVSIVGSKGVIEMHGGRLTLPPSLLLYDVSPQNLFGFANGLNLGTFLGRHRNVPRQNTHQNCTYSQTHTVLVCVLCSSLHKERSTKPAL